MTPTLRPATPDDLETLWSLHRDTMREYVEPIWGWDEGEQREHFITHFDLEKIEVIEVDQEFVGSLRVTEHDEHLDISAIEVLPQHQRRGIGAEVIEQVLDRGRERGVPVRLRVLHTNPARQLYRRLGFRCTENTTHHCRMEWRPPDEAGR